MFVLLRDITENLWRQKGSHDLYEFNSPIALIVRYTLYWNSLVTSQRQDRNIYYVIKNAT